jgi:hypothetical protein
VAVAYLQHRVALAVRGGSPEESGHHGERTTSAASSTVRSRSI